MKITGLDKKIILFRGEPLEMTIVGVDGKEEKIHMTLGDVCAEAVLCPFDTDSKEAATTRYTRGELGGRILKAKKTIELDAKEVAEIKERIGKRYTAAIVFITHNLIEGKKDSDS